MSPVRAVTAETARRDADRTGVYHEAGYRRSENGRRGNLFGQGSTCSGKKYDVELPIIEEVNKVLFDDKPAKEGVKDLMVREKRVEHLNLKWEN